MAGLTAVSMQLRCIDAAREAARLAARGDQPSAVDVARRIAPPEAQIEVRRNGEFLVASVRVRSKLLPSLGIAATAVAAAEPR
ncbi:pilus biosynthesis protein TadE [Mycobacterium kansasii]|uniref:TadE family type IV pilus minor pilin n=1 Tax=Mycobacterium attenuatum TaxID=2341086 RepID=UPI000A0CD079|nr:TadE family type IV pilus minor pilin [Mycobacterium attenuatum]ORB87478.1 pilus biosynthesis protein TadE [Mycobacterium kansasii]